MLCLSVLGGYTSLDSRVCKDSAFFDLLIFSNLPAQTRHRQMVQEENAIFFLSSSDKKDLPAEPLVPFQWEL